MSKFPEPDTFGSDHDRIEALVRAARDYIRPTEDLRPRVLEAAREYSSDRRAEQRLGHFALAVLLLALVVTPAIQWAVLLRPASSTWSSTEVQRRATELARQPDVGSHWALAEAFSQWRHLQAARLGHSGQRVK